MMFFGVARQVLRSLIPAGLALGVIASTATPASAHDQYVVRAGDTLSEIAEDTGTTIVGLMAENDLSSPDRIRIGQTLSIPHRDGNEPVAATPAATSSVSVPASPTYTVAAGDTLSQIALRLGVSTTDLVAANGLSDPNRVRIGQELVVPGGVVEAATYTNLPDRLQAMPERQALIPLFERWSEANELPVDLVMAVAWQESGWNNEAVSFKGAVGIGQIMPATGDWVAADLIGRPELDTTIAEDNIRISARYLRWLLDYLGDEDLALAGYYQGPGAVRSGIMYDDTVQYVANVQIHRQFFTAS